MHVPDAAIKQYMQLYQEDFGEELTLEQGREIATRLIALYEVLSNRLPQSRSMPLDESESADSQQPWPPPDRTAP